ncbi:MAG: hypothetical protein RL660_56 [Bacteroidota bacterium]
MDKRYTYLFDEHGLLLESTMRQYAQQQLSAEEIRAVEECISRDEFSADALEGYMLEYAHSTTEQEAQKESSKLKVSYKKPLIAAAALAALIGLAYAVLQRGHNQQMAHQADKQKVQQNDSQTATAANSDDTVNNPTPTQAPSAVVSKGDSSNEQTVKYTPPIIENFEVPAGDGSLSEKTSGTETKSAANFAAPEPPAPPPPPPPSTVAENEEVRIGTESLFSDDASNFRSDTFQPSNAAYVTDNRGNYFNNNQQSGPSRTATPSKKVMPAPAPAIATPSGVTVSENKSKTAATVTKKAISTKRKDEASTSDGISYLANAKMLYNNKDFKAALTAFESISTSGAATEKEEAAFYIAMCHKQLGDTGKAKKLFQSIARGKGKFAALAKEAMGSDGE